MRVLKGYEGAMMSLAFLGNRYLIIAAGYRRKGRTTVLDVQDFENIELKHELEGEFPAPMALTLAADGELMALSGQSDAVWIYDTKTWQIMEKFPATGLVTTGLAFSPDNKRLLTATPCGEVQFWEVGSWRKVGTLRMNEHARRLAFLDADTLVTSSMEGCVRVWRAAPPDSAQDE